VTEKSRWTRWLAETFVIVGSILLAFGIDAWWDRRGERTAAREHLSVICQDVANDRASLRTYIDANEARSRTRGLFLTASPQEVANLPDDVLDNMSLQAIAIFEPGPNTARTTDLSNLQDQRARELLGSWRMLIADFEENARLHWSALVEVQRAGGINYLARDVGGEMQWDIPEGSAPIRDILADLRSNEQYIGAQLRLQLLISYTAGKARRVIEAADELLGQFCTSP